MSDYRPSVGSALICAWSEIDPIRLDDWRAWHSTEHVPERLALPGFRRGRRFASIDGQPSFFILYEVASPAVLRHPQYIERLNSPTPWTVASASAFLRNRRATFTVTASEGSTACHLLAVVRLRMAGDRKAAAQAARLCWQALRGMRGVDGAHLAELESSGTGLATAESASRPDLDADVGAIVLAYGAEREPMLRALSSLHDAGERGGVHVQHDLYEAEFAQTSLEFHRHAAANA